MLMYASIASPRARPGRTDRPSQIAGLGPSIDALLAILRERKRKILARFETDRVRKKAAKAFAERAQEVHPPKNLRQRFHHAVSHEQIRDLERLWYAAGDDNSPFARNLLPLIESLGDKYQIEQLAAKYAFTGREALTVPQAIEVKEELERIDELIRQLEEARETAQIGIIDMEALAEFAEPGDIDQLSAAAADPGFPRDEAERQGIEQPRHRIGSRPRPTALSGQAARTALRELQPSRPAGTRAPSSAKGPSSCKRRSSTSSATRSPTSTSRARSSTRCCETDR
jgi:hypothetical protein